jgi:hypothetical protein
MATDYARDLDEQLVECKVALQRQAQAMLDLLLEFEARVTARLDAVEARIASARAADAASGESSAATNGRGTAA